MIIPGSSCEVQWRCGAGFYSCRESSRPLPCCLSHKVQSVCIPIKVSKIPVKLVWRQSAEDSIIQSSLLCVLRPFDSFSPLPVDSMGALEWLPVPAPVKSRRRGIVFAGIWFDTPKVFIFMSKGTLVCQHFLCHFMYELCQKSADFCLLFF